jgi:hypothetical protein
MPPTSDSTFQFKAISDQVFVYQGDPNKDILESSGTAVDPAVIIIYGWGDASLKHVSKYTAGFHSLFPSSKIIAVLSPILKAMTLSLDQRIRSMEPVVEEAFRENNDSGKELSPSRRTILMHVMSNTGGMNFAATFEAYRRMYHHPMPHNLLVLDSCPGSTEYTPANVRRFAFAMTVGTAAWFPWPKSVTQWMWFFGLYILRGLEVLVGRESAANFAVKATNSDVLTVKTASRLYLYSKEDAIINWEDIESHAGAAAGKGYRVDRKIFSGSPHVGHMRHWPEEYWKAILQAWINRGSNVESVSANSKNVVLSASFSKDE